MSALFDLVGPKQHSAWRLDPEHFASTWDSGEGAFRVGGRWNSRGKRYVVYCSLDPSTTILEVAVHKTFKVLDTVPHVMTKLDIDAAAVTNIHIVRPDDIPNPNWLRPGIPSIGQQQFGDDLLSKHKFVLIPSVVSRHSWNLIFDRNQAAGLYKMSLQERFALDTRLHAP